MQFRGEAPQHSWRTALECVDDFETDVRVECAGGRDDRFGKVHAHHPLRAKGPDELRSKDAERRESRAHAWSEYGEGGLSGRI